MKEEIINFIQEKKIKAFEETLPLVKFDTIYKTSHARKVYRKTLDKINSKFIFKNTKYILEYLANSKNKNEISKKQEFFKSINFQENDFLNHLLPLKKQWSPEYDLIIVTENTQTYQKLNEKGYPVKLIISDNDLSLLESKDVVQVIDCDNYSLALESLVQAVFLKDIEEAYLERNLEILSYFKENINFLKNNEISESLRKIIEKLEPFLRLIEKEENKKINFEDALEIKEEINRNVLLRLKELTISGESLYESLNKGTLPSDLKLIVEDEIKRSPLPINCFSLTLPIQLDEEEVYNLIEKENSKDYLKISNEINFNSKEIKEIPFLLRELENEILYLDFLGGISSYIKEKNYPQIKEDCLEIKNSKNLFLQNPQEISFYLNKENKCSILTGANSGGKTTLLEHIIQLITLTYIGLPISGEFFCDFFEQVYYFAKNKGSANKGAFETLLTQMSTIDASKKTLILADEIEAVTEPGVAGRIICATANYYLEKNCFLVIATHLGHEIQKTLPFFTRIDGIEAKGLDEKNQLIIDHTPIIGKLANSTPELIVEKMSKSFQKDYFTYLDEYLKKERK